MMPELGLDAYRFSISWPRVLPQGKGEINREGLQFYSDLIDRLIAANLSPIYPVSGNEEDKKAAALQDAYLNLWFLQPLFKGSYPGQLKRVYQKQYERPLVEENDMEVIGQEVDFLGINYYTRNVVEYALEKDVLKFESVDIEDRPKTEIGWEIYPRGGYLSCWYRDFLIGQKQ